MLNDKICLVTGATGGLGKTVVRVLLDAGSTVIAVGRSDESFDRKIDFRKADLLDERAVIALVEDIIKKYGRIDGLANLVGGIYPWSHVTDVDFSVWEKTIALNLTPTFLCGRSAMRQMKTQRSGAIVNIGSQAGLKGSASAGPYGASKAAVINLTQTLADEGKAFNVRANVIIPSTIDTPANRTAMPKADFSRWVTPDEIARSIAFLLSDAAQGITGAVINVPGRV